MRRVFLVAAALGAIASCSANEPAFAAHRHHHRIARDANGAFADRRPAEWCGWFMRRVEHVTDVAFNRALEWAHWGEPAYGPAPGVVVVWNHGHGHGHVGKIVRRAPDGGWIVLSGNDGHAVRERERSLRGVVAFRRAAL